MVDGNGNATTYTYTPWNLPESIIEPSTPAHPAAADRTWTTVYDAAGQPVEQRLPGDVTRTRTYDNLGRLTGETGTGAATTARALDYDALGRITTASSPAGNHTYTWTDRGLLGTATGYGGTATYTYDAEANLTSGSTRPAPPPSATTTPAGSPASVDPLTATTATYTHDTAGRVATISHGTGNSTRTYTYDNLGRLATDTCTEPDATTADVHHLRLRPGRPAHHQDHHRVDRCRCQHLRLRRPGPRHHAGSARAAPPPPTATTRPPTAPPSPPRPAPAPPPTTTATGSSTTGAGAPTDLYT